MGRKIRETYHRFGELLVRRKGASHEAVDEALALQRADLERGRTPRRIGEILEERRVLDKLTIREILHEQKIARGDKSKLKISLEDADGVALLSLEGRLDKTKAEALTRVLERLMNRGFARIAVDLGRLVSTDSQGVSAFISYIDESRARGGDVKFFDLRPEIKIVLDRLGLSHFVQVFDTQLATIHAFDLPIDEYMSRGALGEYISSSKTRQYHLSYCALAQKIHEEDRTYYESKWHARKDAKQPCRKCRP
jgi:anti-anti-sigma factor